MAATQMGTLSMAIQHIQAQRGQVSQGDDPLNRQLDFALNWIRKLEAAGRETADVCSSEDGLPQHRLPCYAGAALFALGTMMKNDERLEEGWQRLSASALAPSTDHNDGFWAEPIKALERALKSKVANVDRFVEAGLDLARQHRSEVLRKAINDHGQKHVLPTWRKLDPAFVAEFFDRPAEAA